MRRLIETDLDAVLIISECRLNVPGALSQCDVDLIDVKRIYNENEASTSVIFLSPAVAFCFKSRSLFYF